MKKQTTRASQISPRRPMSPALFSHDSFFGRECRSDSKYKMHISNSAIIRVSLSWPAAMLRPNQYAADRVSDNYICALFTTFQKMPLLLVNAVMLSAVAGATACLYLSWPMLRLVGSIST